MRGWIGVAIGFTFRSLRENVKKSMFVIVWNGMVVSWNIVDG